jgi:transcriptional regulator with XRE-family HTH domain
MDFNYQFPLGVAEERKRLGMNQEAAAMACGISREMWGKYERGKAVMGAEVLAKFAATGADVQYILTGQRQGQGIGESAVHQAVLDAADVLSLTKKIDADQLARAVVKLLEKNSGAVEKTSQQRVQVGGNFNGQVIEGNAINTAPMVFGGKHKGKA